jgi:hypothetical protein
VRVRLTTMREKEWWEREEGIGGGRDKWRDREGKMGEIGREWV